MNDSALVFTDTSFFKAYIDQKDQFHSKAIEILKHLKTNSIILITSNYILDETFTLLRVKCGLELAIDFKAILEEFETGLKIVRVTVADEANAWDYFLKPWTRLSFTDCVSFALIKRLGINRVVAFDKHFTRAGFKILL